MGDVQRQIDPGFVTRLNRIPARPQPNTDCGLFFRESLKSLSVTASLFPSSRCLASALLRRIDFNRAQVIVELGIGTGAITTEILRRMMPGARLYGIEINPTFVSRIEGKVCDARFVPILGEAERLGAILSQRGVRRADAIVSSLGLTSMAHDRRSSIVEQVAAHLGGSGVLTQYQYIHVGGQPNWSRVLGVKRFAEERFLRGYFREVHSERVMWNLPPATVYTCRP